MTMTVQMMPQATVARSRSTSSGAAPLRNNGYRVLQVVAGNGSTVHRADCAFVAHRDDLHPAGGDAPDLTPAGSANPPGIPISGCQAGHR
jgi:hypothetical protein